VEKRSDTRKTPASYPVFPIGFNGNRIGIGPAEAIDETTVIDLKAVLGSNDR
jgi:hypothetical protein